MVNFFIKYVIFALVFAVIRAKDETTSSVSTKTVKEKKKITEEPIGRRFLEDLDDAQWHVAHLKESDFDEIKSARRSGCKEDTFADKLNKYRRSLKNDAGHIEYVSSNAIPFNPHDLIDETCKIEDVAKSDPTTAKSGAKTATGKDDTTTSASSSITKDTVAKIKDTTTATDKIPVATVKDMTNKKDKKDSDTLTPIVKNGTKRSGDYLISSVEYYDDVVDFDDKLCPDVLDVITLEQDLIREYDVECMLILLWRSLE